MTFVVEENGNDIRRCVRWSSSAYIILNWKESMLVVSMQNQKILITGQWLLVNEALAIHKTDVSYFYRQGRDIFIHYLNNGLNHSEKVSFVKTKEAKEQLKRLCVRWDAD